MGKRTYGITHEVNDVNARLIPSWRFSLALMGMFGGFCLYSMRVNLSLAIVCMVNDTTTTTRNVSSDCPDDISSSRNTTRRGEFNWDRQTRGFLLSSFFIGYLLTQLLGGYLARRINGKVVIGVGCAVMCAATLLTPVSARTHPGLVVLMRILCGIGQGVYFPAFFQLWAVWAPPLEKTKLVTLTISGNNIGSVITFLVSGHLCEHGFDGGWPSIFYIFGAVGVGWVFLWFVVTGGSPATHRWISQQEREYIESKAGQVIARSTMDDPTPWFKLLTSIHVFPLFICQFCYAWLGYTILTSLPQYMRDVLRFDIRSNGLYNSLPQLCMFIITLIVAPVADWMLKKNFFSVTNLRKIIQSIGFLVPGALSLGVAFTNCHQRGLAVALVTLAVGFTGFTRAGLLCTINEVAPRYSGIIMGFSNTFATLTGILAPLTVSALTPQGTADQWRRVFYLGAGFCLLGEIVFMLCASSEPQPWALPKPKKQEKDRQVEAVELPEKAGINGYTNTAYQPEKYIKSA